MATLPHLPTLNYHHLQYFWAVAHEGHLTRAAERLRVAPSAVSTQIARLEQELGHPLFERVGRQLVLTEAGRITLDHADSIFELGRELVGTLHQQGKEQQVLRVGAMATLSRNFQIGFLAPLFGRDDVELVLRSGAFGELLRALEAHRLDVLLANTVPPRDAATPWVAHALAEQPVSLVGRPAGKTRKKSRARPPAPDVRALLEAERLVVPSRETAIRASFDALAERLHVRPLIAAEVDDMAMLRLLARDGVGVAVVPSIVVRDELEGGELVELAKLPGLVETFYAITLRRRFPNPLLATLLGAIR
jgi:LysR family transcriptional activator of nhaA